MTETNFLPTEEAKTLEGGPTKVVESREDYLKLIVPVLATCTMKQLFHIYLLCRQIAATGETDEGVIIQAKK